MQLAPAGNPLQFTCMKVFHTEHMQVGAATHVHEGVLWDQVATVVHVSLAHAAGEGCRREQAERLLEAGLRARSRQHAWVRSRLPRGIPAGRLLGAAGAPKSCSLAPRGQAPVGSLACAESRPHARQPPKAPLGSALLPAATNSGDEGLGRHPGWHRRGRNRAPGAPSGAALALQATSLARA